MNYHPMIRVVDDVLIYELVMFFRSLNFDFVSFQFSANSEFFRSV